MINNFDQESFEKTVVKAEKLAQSNLHLYKFNLLVYALFGYGVIFLVIALLLGLTGATVGSIFLSTGLFILLLKKKILFVIIPTAWMMLKALWVRFGTPGGYKLNREEHTILFEEIDLLCKKLKTKDIHEVILTPEFNAAIIQTPRLGILGWDKNTLIIGLELLLTLSPEQTRSVLAHELGHLSGNHSRFNGWIYRVRVSWHRIMIALDDAESYGAKMMGKFFNWYSPKFEAYSFALARANEYEADTVSAQITSPETTSKALINTHVIAPYIDENYWDFFFKQADTIATPPSGPWVGLENFLINHKPSNNYLKKKLEENLREKTELIDTHPALVDRIHALNMQATIPSHDEKSAAYVWFGEKFKTVINDFDRDWLTHNTNQWKERYEYVVNSNNTIEELSKKETNTLSDEDLWQLSTLSEEFVSQETAFPLFKEFQRRHPEDPDVAFVLGRILFAKGDEELLSHMKIAINSPSLNNESCRLSYLYLTSKGRIEEANWWKNKAEEQNEIDEESNNERSLLNPDDALQKTTLDTETIEQIKRNISLNEDVKKVWIAEKKMKHYPEIPALAIAVQFTGFFKDNEKRSCEIANRLDLECSIFVVPKSGKYKALAKNIIKNGEQLL